MPVVGSYHKGPRSAAHPRGSQMDSGVGASLQPVKEESLFPRHPRLLWCPLSLSEGPPSLGVTLGQAPPLCLSANK